MGAAGNTVCDGGGQGRRLWGRYAVVVLLLAVLAGCGPATAPTVDLVVDSRESAAALQGLEQERAIQPAAHTPPVVEQIDGVAVRTLPEYRIGPGDVLEIVYNIRYEDNPEVYRLEVQDKLNISFPFNPQLSSTVLLRTDGRISLPLIGEIFALGLTTDELQKKLVQGYGKYLRNPTVTVSLVEFNVKIDELRRAITTAARGQSKIAPVAPDGRIALPILGNLQAAGLTVDTLEQQINSQYEKHVRNLHVTLILNEIRHMKFYVFGEVTQPGVYELPNQAGILDVFAVARGYTTAANLEQVLVFRSNGLKEPVVFMVNVQAMLDQGQLYPELTIQPADMVYVPKTRLDHATDMIAKIFTKGLYSILPFQSSFSVSYEILKGDAVTF